MRAYGARHRPLLGTAVQARVAQWAQPSLIKSIQRGTIVIATSQTVNTATITAVVTGNTDLVFLGCLPSVDQTPNNAQVRIVLTNTTTITATRGNAAVADTATVTYEVVEYWPGVIKSAQRSTIVCGAGTATSTITTVNTAKSIVRYLGYSTADGTSNDASNYKLPMLDLTNATTVTATSGAANATVSFQVLEYY